MSIAGVLVLYNPDPDDLRLCIDSLIPQVDQVFVVDNSTISNSGLLCLMNEKITYIWLGSNLGIGKAQNVGIKAAIKNGAKFVILSDQDTRYPLNYVTLMMDAYNKVDASGIAALAPIFYDVHRKLFVPIIQRRSIFRRKIFQSYPIQPTTEVIASGMFIPVLAFSQIGLMNEDMFIDWVDFEWCWRANSAGLKIYSIVDVVINHSLGQGSISVAGRKYPVHSPFRYYYVIRNGISAVFFHPLLSLSWRINIFANVLRYAFGYILLGKPKLEAFKYVFKGFLHGFMNRLGRYE